MTKSKRTSGNGAATYVARLATDEKNARRISDFLSETLDLEEAVCAAFEQSAGHWQLDVHFRDKPELAGLRDMIATVSGKSLAAKLTIETVKPRDWVKESLIGLRPVTAGRFVIHGAHDRDRVPDHCVGIEIEAATAFGTGHHGTTRGCLLALDRLARLPRRPRHILDIGTGTGILAIAAAKLFRVPVLATDIDARSVRTARENARLNGVGAFVTTLHATDLRAAEIVRRAPFDLVTCNILLKPLQKLAAPVARQLMPNASLVLSGILASQKNATLAAYRLQGLVPEQSFLLDGWVTPLMSARAR